MKTTDLIEKSGSGILHHPPLLLGPGWQKKEQSIQMGEKQLAQLTYCFSLCSLLACN